MPRLLGEILVTNKALTAPQLDEAISNQVVYGGKLGTNLMDLGYVRESILAKALSYQLGIPTIEPQAYIKIHKNIAKVLPKDVAERTLSVPLVVKDKTLHLVMAEPNNVAHQDEVRFATGYKLEIYVAPEVRIYFLLNRLYGTKRDIRYVTFSLTDSMELRSENLQMVGAKGGGGADAPDRPRKVMTMSGLEEADESVELMSETEFESLTAGVGMGEPGGEEDGEDVVLLGDVDDDDTEVVVLDDEVVDLEEEAPPPEPVAESAVDDSMPVRKLTLQQATSALEHVEDRDQIARVVLGFASSTFDRTALFMVRPGMVMGWDGTGQGIGRETIERLMIPLNVPSVFKTVYDMQAHFLGAIPKSPVNDRFVKSLGGGPPRSSFVIPILFKGKVVNILYGDNGPGKDASYDIGELLILAMKIPMSFEELVRRAKKP